MVKNSPTNAGDITDFQAEEEPGMAIVNRVTKSRAQLKRQSMHIAAMKLKDAYSSEEKL